MSKNKFYKKFTRISVTFLVLRPYNNIIGIFLKGNVCKLFVKQTVLLSRFAVFCRIYMQKGKSGFRRSVPTKNLSKTNLSFSPFMPPNPIRHDRLLKNLMPQATETRFRHRCFCRILSVGRSAVFSRSAGARIGNVRYIICRTAEKGCRRTECRTTVFSLL